MVAKAAEKPKIIGLTGNIGSGKTTVLKEFEKLGIKTLNSDYLVGKAYGQKKAQKELEKFFGTAEKKKIAKIALKDKKKLKILEKIVQPIVLKELKAKIKKFGENSKKNSGGKKIFVVEVPLLFELKLQKLFSKIIVVHAPQNLRIARMEKRGYSKQEFMALESNQIPLGKKIKLAGITIDNGKSFFETRKSVESTLKKF